jgi:hypothetical protein
MKESLKVGNSETQFLCFFSKNLIEMKKLIVPQPLCTYVFKLPTYNKLNCFNYVI